MKQIIQCSRREHLKIVLTAINCDRYESEIVGVATSIKYINRLSRDVKSRHGSHGQVNVQTNNFTSTLGKIPHIVDLVKEIPKFCLSKRSIKSGKYLGPS